MTHEELIAKIDRKPVYPTITETSALTYHVPTIHFTAQLQSALRAVVELHKPQGNFGDTYIDGKPTHPYCPECIDPDVYPCPTIQVIEKELK